MRSRLWIKAHRTLECSEIQPGRNSSLRIRYSKDSVGARDTSISRLNLLGTLMCQHRLRRAVKQSRIALDELNNSSTTNILVSIEIA